ncbi:phospholipase D-like domain-containing protein [Aliarcobacter butzleri]|uniref:hypothetical protein n=1 Tax=Aliarcobacter butzleri TaxID=28197 RepID=UPI00126054F5|nr:hypothetical protein [Aliarcobacter butzleri]
MPKRGDSYIVTLKETYIQWGDYRNTNSRERIIDEVYLPIPAAKAREFNIYNSNKEGVNTEYDVITSDGFIINGKLKAQGCSTAGNVHAKNLSGSGNLKLLGKWFTHINAKVGDEIKIEWTNETTIKLTKL